MPPIFPRRKSLALPDRRRVGPRSTVSAWGFSLIEVVLAIGLATFALLVIFSLMPAGVRSLQESNRQIVETEIFNTLRAELGSTPFFKSDGTDLLAEYRTSRFPIYFDNEGTEVPDADEAIFTVQCAAPVVQLGSELKSVTVSIGFRHDPNAPATGGQITKRTFLLANRQGKGI